MRFGVCLRNNHRPRCARAYEPADATERILDANTPDLAHPRESMKRFLDEVAPR